MNFEPTEDQQAFLDAVHKLVDRHAAGPLLPQRVDPAADVEHELTESGYLDAIAVDELGPVAATLALIALARLPRCVEAAASGLLAPWLCPGLPRPYAVLWEGDAATTRWLPVARTVLRVGEGGVQAARLGAHDVDPVASTYAYPMGRLRDAQSLAWEPVGDADAARKAHRLWQVGVAAEIVGCLSAGLDAVLEHVKQRRQFGRPIGSFQAMQHRLAQCTVAIEGARWLALRAASTGTDADARLACAHAQDAVRGVAYDLHQFMGAMGLTLEHPLHRWTYRAKLLRTERGGPDRQMVAAADAAWGL